MKANEAPERIYCESDGLGNIVKVHNIKWPDDEAENIEYTRTDAFIEKVINFLNYKLNDVVATRVPGTIIPHHVAKQEVIDDFRNYMKGE